MGLFLEGDQFSKGILVDIGPDIIGGAIKHPVEARAVRGPPQVRGVIWVQGVRQFSQVGFLEVLRGIPPLPYRDAVTAGSVGEYLVFRVGGIAQFL